MAAEDGREILSRNHTIRSQTLRSHRPDQPTASAVVGIKVCDQDSHDASGRGHTGGSAGKKKRLTGVHIKEESLPKATGNAPSQRQTLDAARVRA